MAARKGALGGVDVTRQPSNVLHFVFALVIASNKLSVTTVRFSLYVKHYVLKFYS